MRARWTVTVDARSPRVLAKFWAAALGYVPVTAPPGFDSWDAWFDAYDVPVEERDGVAAVVDPAGVLPQISFLAFPEGKTVKNRLHLDVQAGGGRDEVPADVRWSRVQAEVQRLTELGATVLAVHGEDHVVMADPEGDEFCVV